MPKTRLATLRYQALNRCFSDRMRSVLLEEKEGKSTLHIHVSAGQEKPYYIRQYGMSIKMSV